MFILTPVEGEAIFFMQLVHPWQVYSIDILMYSCVVYLHALLFLVCDTIVQT